MERAAASYKMKHGVAEYLMEDLKTELQNTFFCLNLGESTNANQEKAVACLVSYFSKERNEVTVRHLDPFKVLRADAD